MSVKNNIFFQKRSIIYLFSCFLFLSCSVIYSVAHAENCWVGSSTLSMGAVNAQGSSVVSTDVTVNCNSNNTQTVAYRMCFVVDSDNPAGIDPRSMISYDTYPAPTLKYNLYYNAAKTQVIPDSNTLSTVQCQTFLVPANSGSPSTTIKIYGQVVSGQNVPAGAYKTNNMTAKLLYAYRYGTTPPTDASTLASKGSASNYMLVNANFENSCLILSGSDIDFGAVTNLNNTLTRSGTIQMSCPTGTNMKVSLSNGNNALSNQRRMKNLTNNYIQYNLYQDASLTTAWQGNIAYSFSNQTIPVYAVILPQTIESIGQYFDTIIVTLTY